MDIYSLVSIIESNWPRELLAQVHAAATHTISLPAVLDGLGNDSDDDPDDDPDDGTGCVGKTMPEVAGAVEKIYYR